MNFKIFTLIISFFIKKIFCLWKKIFVLDTTKKSNLECKYYFDFANYNYYKLKYDYYIL